MLPQEAEEYIKCIRRLGEEYKNDIKIYAGFEAEYFRDSFERFKRLCIDIGADYLILGQHFLGREIPFLREFQPAVSAILPIPTFFFLPAATIFTKRK